MIATSPRLTPIFYGAFYVVVQVRSNGQEAVDCVPQVVSCGTYKTILSFGSA